MCLGMSTAPLRAFLSDLFALERDARLAVGGASIAPNGAPFFKGCQSRARRSSKSMIVLFELRLAVTPFLVGLSKAAGELMSFNKR